MLNIVKARKHDVFGNALSKRIESMLQISGGRIVAANYRIGVVLLQICTDFRNVIRL